MFAFGLLLICLTHSLLHATHAENFVKNCIRNNAIFLVGNSNIFNEVLLQFDHPKILFNIKNSSRFMSFHHFTEKKILYVISAENSTELEEILATFFKYKEWNSKSKHLIILKEMDENTAKQSLKALWDYDVYNAAIISSQNSSGYTWYPFKAKSKCGTFIHLRSFNTCSIFNPFSKKTIKTKNCNIRISWNPRLFPFTDSPKSSLPGIMMSLLLWIKASLNISIIHTKGVYTQNVVSEHIPKLLQSIQREKLDIIIDDILSFYHPIGDNRLEQSAPPIAKEIIWVMPQKMPTPPWVTFLQVFSVIHWLQLLAAYLMLLTLWSFSGNSNFPSSLLTITKLFLLQNIRNTNCLSKRLIMATGSFLIVHFSVFFTSRLISMLTNPYYTRTITTLEELPKVATKFTYNEPTSNLLQEINYNVWQQLETKRIGERGDMDHNQFLKFLSNSLNDTNLVFSINAMLLYFYVRNVEEVETHPIKLSTHYFSIPLRKRFMLIEKINVEILRSLELGLMQKWYKDARSYSKKLYAQREGINYDKKPFSLYDLYPVFFVWLFGISLSLLVFVGELLMDSMLCVRLPYKGYLE